MLNCSTCHKRKPIEHFYSCPDHRAHVPARPTADDNAALARLMADGLMGERTNGMSAATLASARERLATSGRPPESDTQRLARERAQARAVEREEEDAREAEAQAQIDKWALRGVGVGALAFVGWLGWQVYAVWRDGASA